MENKEKFLVLTTTPTNEEEYNKLPFIDNVTGMNYYYKVFNKLEKSIEYAEIEGQMYNHSFDTNDKPTLELESDVALPYGSKDLGYKVTCGDRTWYVTYNTIW